MTRTEIWTAMGCFRADRIGLTRVPALRPFAPFDAYLAVRKFVSALPPDQDPKR
jgi:hypothetical protein